MKLDLYAAGYTAIEQKMKRAGCGVILTCTHPDGRIQQRRLGVRLGQATSQFASLRATQLALLALRRLPPVVPVTLHVDRYVATMLERQGGRYRAVPSANAAAVADLRQTYERCQYPTIMVVKPTADLPECLGLAKEAAIAQTSTDSGTYLVEHVQGKLEGAAG